MGFEKMIPIAAAFAILAVPTGQLPKIINLVHKVQIQLIQDSKASKWPKAMMLRNPGSHAPNQ